MSILNFLFVFLEFEFFVEKKNNKNEGQMCVFNFFHGVEYVSNRTDKSRSLNHNVAPSSASSQPVSNFDGLFVFFCVFAFWKSFKSWFVLKMCAILLPPFFGFLSSSSSTTIISVFFSVSFH